MEKNIPPVSIQELRDAFDYNPITGLILKKTSLGMKVTGHVNNYLGYFFVSLNAHHLLGHRVAWAIHHGEWPSDGVIDHINRDKLDNRIVNLRVVPHASNLTNSLGRRNLPKCVFKVGNKYRVRMSTSYGDLRHGGYFFTVQEATEKRDRLARMRYGDVYHLD